MEQAYARVLNTAYKVRTKSQRDDLKALADQIDAANSDISKGRKLLLKEEIDAQDFREIKRENEKKIEMLEARLMEISTLSTNIEPLLEKAVSNLAIWTNCIRKGTQNASGLS